MPLRLLLLQSPSCTLTWLPRVCLLLIKVRLCGETRTRIRLRSLRPPPATLQPLSAISISRRRRSCSRLRPAFQLRPPRPLLSCLTKRSPQPSLALLQTLTLQRGHSGLRRRCSALFLRTTRWARCSQQLSQQLRWPRHFMRSRRHDSQHDIRSMRLREQQPRPELGPSPPHENLCGDVRGVGTVQ